MGFKERLTKRTRARALAFVGVFAAVMGLASPAFASTSVTGSVYGSPCGTNSMFSNFSTTATMDGSAYVGFANLKFGASVHLAGGCGIASQLCVDAKVLLNASNAVGQSWTSIGTDSFQVANRTITGYSAYMTATSCQTINSTVGGISVSVDAADAYLWTADNIAKINDYTLYSRARILYNGAWQYTAYAAKTVTP